MRVERLAVAVPAYNEADGIAEFLTELDAELDRLTEAHRLVVADDASTDATVATLEQLRPRLSGELVVLHADRNRGHGPTVLRAYRESLASRPDLVLQVDGDGQFEVGDVELLLSAVSAGASVATGRRVDRADGALRTLISASLRLLLRLRFGVTRRDANCPFRLYDAATLERLLEHVPVDAAVPNILLTVAETRSGVAHEEVDVRHRHRRGDDPVGSTWRTGSRIPWRLLRLCVRAAGEVVLFRPSRKV